MPLWALRACRKQFQNNYDNSQISRYPGQGAEKRETQNQNRRPAQARNVLHRYPVHRGGKAVQKRAGSKETGCSIHQLQATAYAR